MPLCSILSFNSMIVRLKGAKKNIDFAAYLRFNSMIVRLKASSGAEFAVRAGLFQFYDSPIKRPVKNRPYDRVKQVSIL